MIKIGRATWGGKRGEAIGFGGEDFDDVGGGDFGSNGGSLAGQVDLEGDDPLDGKKGFLHNFFFFFTDESVEVDDFFCGLGGRRRGGGARRRKGVLKVSVRVNSEGADGFGVVDHHFLNPSNQPIYINKLFSEMRRFREIENGRDRCFSNPSVLIRQEENKGRGMGLTLEDSIPVFLLNRELFESVCN